MRIYVRKTSREWIPRPGTLTRSGQRLPKPLSGNERCEEGRSDAAPMTRRIKLKAGPTGKRGTGRYEQEFGMPIRRVASSSKGAVIAKTVELDAWITARPMRHALQLPQSAAICLSLFDDMRRNIEKMERLLLEALELRLQVVRSLRVVRDDDRVAKPETRMMRSNLRRRLLANR